MATECRLPALAALAITPGLALAAPEWQDDRDVNADIFGHARMQNFGSGTAPHHLLQTPQQSLSHTASGSPYNSGGAANTFSLFWDGGSTMSFTVNDVTLTVNDFSTPDTVNYIGLVINDRRATNSVDYLDLTALTLEHAFSGDTHDVLVDDSNGLQRWFMAWEGFRAGFTLSGSFVLNDGAQNSNATSPFFDVLFGNSDLAEPIPLPMASAMGGVVLLATGARRRRRAPLLCSGVEAS